MTGHSEKALANYADRARIHNGRLRAIEIGGYFFEPSAYHDGDLSRLLQGVFAMLPSDAVIVPSCGLLSLQAVSDGGLYCDARVIFVHSEQFDVVPDGAAVPRMEFTFTRNGAERLKRWYWRLYFRLANRFVRRWPLVVEY